ncbi:MAG: TIGR04282 family arsenosugar biosynthesis glycosyltransferase, partial [Nitrososphaera sp.]
MESGIRNSAGAYSAPIPPSAAKGVGLVGVYEIVMTAGRDGKQRIGKALVVVAKAPSPGLVKTRLCPPLTLAEASALYECLLEDIVSKMWSCQGSEFWIAYAPEGEEYFKQNFPERALLTQRGKDLGERLHHIFVDLFHMGYKEIIVADSDSPTVPLSSIQRAYRQLNKEDYDVVLGPSSDGGYYLIGLKCPAAGLFQRIPWSTELVMEKTLERASELGLKAGLLPVAYDIDIEEDLRRLWKDFAASRELKEQAPKTYAYLANLLGNTATEKSTRLEVMNVRG